LIYVTAYTQIILELIDVLLILGVFIPVFFVGIWQLNRINPGKREPKKAQNSADGSVSELFAVQTEQIKEIIKSKNNQIASYQKQLRQTEEETVAEEPEILGKAVTFEQITELVKMHYPKYSKILPLFKGEIMKAVKGMTLNEIVQYIGSFTGQTQDGGIAQGGTPQNPQDWDPNRA